MFEIGKWLSCQWQQIPPTANREHADLQKLPDVNFSHCTGSTRTYISSQICKLTFWNNKYWLLIPTKNYTTFMVLVGLQGNILTVRQAF